MHPFTSQMASLLQAVGGLGTTGNYSGAALCRAGAVLHAFHYQASYSPAAAPEAGHE